MTVPTGEFAQSTHEPEQYQLMKRDRVLDYRRLRREPCPAGVAARPAGVTRREGIPMAPEPTV